jgi:hypothetical protein
LHRAHAPVTNPINPNHQVFCAVADRSPERVAAVPGALQALSSALSGTAADTIDGAARALCNCASGSSALARRVADTPGSLAALVGLIASSNAGDGHNSAVLTLFQVAAAGADLAARVISTPGAPQALSQAALRCSDVPVAKRAVGVLVEAARVRREQAGTFASPDVLAALVSASGRADVRGLCMGVLSVITSASPSLALRVADTPGAEAAALAALTTGDLETVRFAATALEDIVRADAERAARLLSVPEAPAALARLLQSTDATSVEASTSEGLKVCVLLPPLSIWAGTA